MAKFIRNIIVCICIISILLVGFVGIGQLVPYQGSRSYYVEMRKKYDRFMSRKEPGIILVGGSNVAFGFDTKEIERQMNMPAINLGLHAGLKRDFYLNMCRQNINPGDIFILAFEYSAYNEDLMTENITWYTVDNNIDLMKLIPMSNMFNLLRYYPIYLLKKTQECILSPNPLPDREAYQSKSFDEYGDNIFERYENIHTKEEIEETKYIQIKKDIISDESVKAFKEFREYCESKGAKVYATCPSVDEYALVSIENNGKDFKKYYEEKTGIKMISEPSDYVLNTKYFYDTDYHLNLNGVKVRTNMFIEDLKAVF